ncbi:MAG: transglycosylase [Acidimicrobiales bacterium]|nr:transglycosylase [Acidimicrobiales bacterium]
MSLSRRGRPPAAILLSTTATLATVLLSPLTPADAAPGEGQILAQGGAAVHGSPGETAPAVAGLAASPSGGGYWVLTADGGVRAYGDATYIGSAANDHLAHPAADLAAHPSGKGYWMTTSNGEVRAYGYARQYGSLVGRPLAQPIVGMAATPTGNGYWLVASDGGVFSFGDARYWGSTGNRKLNSPVVDMAAAPDGRGYWMVAGDGGVFSFGSAIYVGSLGGTALTAPVVSMAAGPVGAGYWLATADGRVRAFGSAHDFGSPTGVRSPVADLAARPASDGYWLATGAERRVRAASAGRAVSYQAAEADGPPDAHFDRLAQCEAGGRWHLNTGNGYYGGLQFSASTWRSHGGPGLASDHPRETQIEIARRVWRESGWRAWPSCSRQVGLR